MNVVLKIESHPSGNNTAKVIPNGQSNAGFDAKIGSLYCSTDKVAFEADLEALNNLLEKLGHSVTVQGQFEEPKG